MELKVASYNDIVVSSKKKGCDMYTSQNLYEVAFAAFMITDYEYVQEVIKVYKEKFPQDINILDIEILYLGERGNFEEVLQICQKYKLTSLAAYLVRAKIYEYKGQRDTSKDIIYKGLKKYPDNFILEYNLAGLFYSEGKVSTALEYYDMSMSHGDYLYAYSKKLKLLKFIGDKKSYNDLKLKIENILGKGDVWDESLIRGNIYYGDENYIGAIEKYKKYLEIRPKDFYTFDALGNCYFNIEDYTQAIEYYKKAIEVNDKISYPVGSIAKIFFRLGQNNESIQLCKNILQLNSSDFTAYYLLGRNYFSLKKYDISYEYFNRAYILNKEHHMCQRYLKKLEKLGI